MGSSAGRGTCSIAEREPARTMIRSAICSTVASSSLPMFTGPASPDAANARMPATSVPDVA